MAKGLGIAFLITLIGGHLADQEGDALERPLSLFRDVEPVWIGYAMFALLVALAAEMTRTAWRLSYRSQFVVYLFMTFTLTVTALTPSFVPLHTLSANVSMLTLFLNYAWLLYQNHKLFWLMVHVLIPTFLLRQDLIDTSGMWEKGMDLYLVAAVVVHHHFLEQGLPVQGNVRRLPENRSADKVA